MRSRFKLALLFIVALAVLTAGTVLAEDPPPGPETCTGTVILVEGNTITVDRGDGTFCTVTLVEGEYDHPIVNLLGTYFTGLSAEDFGEALDTLQVCPELADDCDSAEKVQVIAVTDNGDGSYTVTYLDAAGLEVEFVTDDQELADSLSMALDLLQVDWQVTDEGNVVQTVDKIAMYHDEGIGFGVLVKLFIIAEESLAACDAEDLASEEEPCGVTVEELVEQFQSGIGMGELFALYGKPTKLGVGHIRQSLNGKERPAWSGAKNKSDDGADGDGDEEAKLTGPPGQQKKDKVKKGPPENAGQNNGQGQANGLGHGDQQAKEKKNQSQGGGNKGKNKGKK